ncbi:hypothetical protein [Paenibacillus sp. MMS20-IR301]|nr:hypothetical protein [Paenibacillus sp. MMS20-IR301]WNS43228.1 hypothetical protein LOS79_30535 [Paenibacillus sp. MMS20-IR301]
MKKQKTSGLNNTSVFYFIKPEMPRLSGFIVPVAGRPAALRNIWQIK